MEGLSDGKLMNGLRAVHAGVTQEQPACHTTDNIRRWCPIRLPPNIVCGLPLTMHRVCRANGVPYSTIP